MAATSGLSIADILKVGMNKVEVEAILACEKREREGFNIAREMFEVVYACSTCGQPHLSIDTGEQQEAAAKPMTQAAGKTLSAANASPAPPTTNLGGNL